MHYVHYLYLFFLEYCFRYIFEFLKDKGMHQCDLFAQGELSIENVLLLFKRVFLFYNHDADVGLFYGKFYVSIKVFITNICLPSVCQNLFSLVYCFYLFLVLLLLCNGDVESNPGLKKNKEFALSCCHWNVNSLIDHDCAKVSSLEAYNLVFKYELICINER